MSVFEVASRKKFRYSSTRGELTTEQLWDLPLTSNNSFNLNIVAKTIANELKSAEDESFVAESADPAKTLLTQKLEVVKSVIAIKIAEKKAAEKKAADNERRKKLVEALAIQEDKALASLSREEILKQLQEIDNADG
ncbi:hypothetical protein B9J07_27945 [Sinorhizobium sp. LM21]|uniref:hypothetical protein n=1 Tax=Sinorhizobium sp. LM21 TaxID=1449788 RepID=UPI0005D7F8FF|nr:hypothetical protein [Sinorhizobium sp. LM21]AJW30175.1 hypothetical protein pLM21S1_p55 [Sinorhizobium sp. LM21]OWZ90422.1 hypothetical protein B9J07_27945 [Sinorhizobium sp. LM21]